MENALASVNWEEAKGSIMLHALRKKFATGKLRDLLLATGDRPLVEGSPFDSYWGCGRTGKGKNRLGELLMLVRAELRGEKWEVSFLSTGKNNEEPTMNIPLSERALLIRTDFADPSAWQKLITAIRNPADPFIFNMEIVDDRANSDATVDQLVGALPEAYPHSFMVVADSMAISQPEHPLLVVDLYVERGRRFRAVAAQIGPIDNNLSIANMDFEEFAELVDDAGVFRGIPDV
jgi:hypothetical protein